MFIAMEYMELGDLGRHIGTPWSEGDTKIVAEQLLKGLTVLHKAGVAHRDLKPEVSLIFTNVLCALRRWYFVI